MYSEVRGLSRGIAVLRALNALPGGVGTVADLARQTGIHRTTVKRLLETLRTEGLVLLKDDATSYSLGFEVRRLSEGYVAAAWIDQIAGPLMRKYVQALSWPSDLATPDGGFMIVRESTHRFSLLSQHRATIGIRFPMLVSSLGRAWMSWCTDDQREAQLGMLSTRSDSIGEMARDTSYVRRVIRATRQRGYAINHGEWTPEPDSIGIGFPIMAGHHAIGALNLVLQRNVVSEKDVAERYVPRLQQLASEISSGVDTQFDEFAQIERDR